MHRPALGYEMAGTKAIHQTQRTEGARTVNTPAAHTETLRFLDSPAYRDGYADGARMAVHGRTETLGAVSIPTRWLGGDLEKAWDGWTIAAHDYHDGLNQAITDVTAVRAPAVSTADTGRRTPPVTTTTDAAGNPRHETPVSYTHLTLPTKA